VWTEEAKRRMVVPFIEIGKPGAEAGFGHGGRNALSIRQKDISILCNHMGNYFM
jgi:hypothetical protein